MPRKVAELLRSEEPIHESLMRLSSLVKVLGGNARMLERVVAGSAQGVPLTRGVLRQGICGEEGRSFPDFASALKELELNSVWRAALLAGLTEFVVESTSSSGISRSSIVATAWANAETARWVATKHVVDPDEAFVTALLLDIGLVAMVHSLPEVYSAFAKSGDNRPVELFEIQSLGFDHCAVGTSVLRTYKFPEDLVHQVLTHHSPSQNLDMFGKVLRAATVAVANEGGDSGLGSSPPKLDLPVLEGALLKTSDEAELRQRARASLEAALRFTSGTSNKAA